LCYFLSLLYLDAKCLIIVTKVDELAKTGEDSISTDNFFNDARVIQRCKDIRNTFRGNIFPMKNYENNPNITTSRNYVALKSLEMALP